MGKNHLKGSLIPKSAANNNTQIYINKDATQLFNSESTGDTAFVFINLRHLQISYQCFSDWTKPEMTQFWKFHEAIHNMTWIQVLQTSGKKNKTGLAYTEIPKRTYPTPAFKKSLSTDITLFELRVSGNIRVHGFRNKSIFYICWLDRSHSICK